MTSDELEVLLAELDPLEGELLVLSDWPAP
jgi:hypothetical protein